MRRNAGQIYLEFVPSGNFLKATAIDAASGREASVIGPLTAPQASLEALAIAKLRRLLGDAPSPRKTKTPPAMRRGLIA